MMEVKSAGWGDDNWLKQRRETCSKTERRSKWINFEARGQRSDKNSLWLVTVFRWRYKRRWVVAMPSWGLYELSLRPEADGDALRFVMRKRICLGFYVIFDIFSYPIKKWWLPFCSGSRKNSGSQILCQGNSNFSSPSFTEAMTVCVCCFLAEGGDGSIKHS